MVHELTHALGMAHQCGNQDWRSPAAPGGRHSCAMAYSHHWLLDSPDKPLAQRKPRPWTSGDGDVHLCAPHISAIRKAQLADDNTSLGRKLGW